MSRLGDRILMTIIVVTGVAGLVGWYVSWWVLDQPDPFVRFVLPALLAVLLVVVVFFVWEGLDVMD